MRFLSNEGFATSYQEAAGEGGDGGGSGGDGGSAPVDDVGGGNPPGDAGGTPPAGGSGDEAGARPWIEGITNPDLRAWVSNKNFDSLDTAVSSYQKLEKLMGAGPDHLLRLPADGNLTPEGAPEVFQRLGMPAKPEEYQFHIPEGMQPDEGLQDWARGTFHELGLSQTQADGVNRAFQQLQESQAKQAADDYEASVKMGETTLQQKYGSGYDRFVKQGAMATAALGLTPAMVTAIEKEIGYEATIEWAGNLGSKLSEDQFELGDPNDGGTNDMWGMSPDDARARYQARLADQEWVKALTTKNHPQHKAAVEERGKLFRLIHGEE